MSERILLIDDDDSIRKVIGYMLDEAGYTAETAASAEAGLKAFSAQRPDLVLSDIKMPKKDGIQLLGEFKSIDASVPVIILTAFGTVETAVEAMKRGAADYLTKPISRDELLMTVAKILKMSRLERENESLRDTLNDRFRFASIVGLSPAMGAVFETLRKVAPTDATVLITGESGTGKELIAKAIHFNSPRRAQRLVTINCAAIPHELLESELFGHVRGAFTGAVRDKSGKFEQANGGTLFLDEIGSMPVTLQAKLLRALQEREIERVGESRPIKFDARVVAASNMELKKMVKEGTFREDLYYRLNVIPITLPPLRERREDIPLIARHFVQKSCKSNNLQLKTLTQEAVRAIMSYTWPGNIRQLENAIEHAVAMSGQEREIPANTLPADVMESSGSLLLPTVAIPDEGINFTSVVSQLERELISRCLEKTGGNKRQAARLLNLSRTTLIDKLHRLNIAAATEPSEPVAN